MLNSSLRILWVKTGLLHPLDSGGKLRTYNMLKEIKKRHHITFLALASSQINSGWKEKASEYCHEVIAIPWKETSKFTWAFYLDLARNLAFSRLPYSIEKYWSSVMREEIRKLDDKGFDLFACDFLTPAVNINGRLNTATLLFQHNVESQIWKRHYEAKNGLLSRSYFWVQWKRMMAFEKNTCARFDAVVTVSPHDSEMLRSEFHLGNILGDVPTGVDIDYFYPPEKSLKKGNHLVFTGSMDWLPNEDAVLYFTKEIYPIIKAAIPDVTLTIAGRNPSRKISELHSSDSSIHITGTVDDIRPTWHLLQRSLCP